MSFVLPGNARQLRFTGEAEAAPEALGKTGENALGKPRERKAIPSAEIWPAGRGFDESNVATSAYVRTEVYADEPPTMALDRDAEDVLPGPRRKVLERPARLVPFLRPPPSADAETIVAPMRAPLEPRVIRTPVSTLTYALWVLAGLLTGVITYHVAPQMLARFEAPPTAASPR